MYLDCSVNDVPGLYRQLPNPRLHPAGLNVLMEVIVVPLMGHM